MSKFAPSNQGQAVGPVSPAQAATSGKGGEVLVVGTGVTVPSGSPYAGTYDLSAVDASDGPVFLKAPGYTGTPGTGNTLTGVNGLAAGDIADGSVILSDFAWVPAVGDQSQGPTREQAENDALGLRLEQRAFNAAGARLAEAQVIASPTFAEQRLTGGRLILTDVGRDQAVNPITQMIVMTSYIWRAASGGPVFAAHNPITGNFDQQFTYVSHDATNWRVFQFALLTSNGVTKAFQFVNNTSITLQDGDRLDILASIEVANSTAVLGANASRVAYRVNGGEWIYDQVNNAKNALSVTTLPGDVWRVGATQASQSTTLSHEIVRLAIWLDEAADPHDEEVRSRFFATDAVQPIEIATFFHGAPAVRFDSLSAVQSGTNQGTYPGAWTSEGTWVDAS